MMTKNIARYVISAACLVFVAYPLDASAQSKPPVSVQVSQLFAQGDAAYAKGDKQGAYEAFKAAWALQKSYDIAANLGIVELKLGKYCDAAEHLMIGLNDFPPTGQPAHRKATEKKLAEALDAVGQIHVRTGVAGAQILVDGHPVTALRDGVVFVEPGAHVIEATAAGYTTARAHVNASRASTQQVTLTLQPVADKTERRSVVPGALLGSVGGAAVVTGIALLGAWASKKSHARDLQRAIMDAGHGCVTGATRYDSRCQELESTASMGNTFQRAGIGLLAGGGAAAVASVIYFVVPPSRSSASAGGLGVTPALSATTTGLVFSGAF